MRSILFNINLYQPKSSSKMAKWGVIGIDENEFLANAVLLAIHEPCQYVKEQPGDDGNDPTRTHFLSYLLLLFHAVVL